MAGSNKIWRAPVAGLASVAMLATLGVSAMTANAAGEQEATVTIHGNGLKIDYMDGATEKSADDYTIKYTYNPDAAPGDRDSQATVLANKLANLNDGLAVAVDNPEIMELSDTVIPAVNGGSTTLFFKSAAYGVADDAFQAGVDVATDLYVHYGYDSSEAAADQASADQVIDVNLTGLDGYDSSNMPNVLIYKDGKMDRIAEWQLPTDTNYGDDKLVESYTVDDKANVDLTSDLYDQVTVGDNALDITAKMVDPAKIVKVNFNNWGTTAGHEYTFTSKDTEFALASGESFSTRYAELPTAHAKGDENTVATKWATRKQVDGKYQTDKVFSVDDSVTTNLQLYVAEAATTYTVTFEDDAVPANTIQTVEVAKGDKVAKPADPTKAEDKTNLIRYTFDKWLDATNGGTEEYDFSQPVNSDLTLKASFKVSEMGVSFDPNHDNVAAEVIWFKTGDTFKVSENPTRDGYTFEYWEDVNHTDARKFVGAKLRVIGDNNTIPALQRVYVSNGSDATGSKTEWRTISNRTFTAKWSAATPEETLAQVEGNVPDSFLRNGKEGYKSGDEQSVFTADSFDQYVSDYQDYLAAKEAAGTLTNAEAADLYDQLSEAQSKLVFKAEKTMQRWQKNDQHIYTDSSAEQKALKLAGWKHEALADFNTVDVDAIYEEINPTGKDGSDKDIADAIVNGLLTKVSRLYEYATGNYMLTADENEVKVLTSEAKTWKNETFSAVYTPKNGTVEADRFYVNYNGEHLIITDPEESAALKADTTNFHYDGVKFWVY